MGSTTASLGVTVMRLTNAWAKKQSGAGFAKPLAQFYRDISLESGKEEEMLSFLRCVRR
jgi:hypothetical protein